MQDLTFRQMSLKMKRKERATVCCTLFLTDTSCCCLLSGGWRGRFQYSSDRTGAGLAADDADL